MADIKTSLVDRFKNPALWLTIIGCFIWIIIRLNAIEGNTKDIKTIEQRLDKKIEILNKLELKVYEMRLKQKDKEIENLKASHEKEIKLLETIHKLKLK